MNTIGGKILNVLFVIGYVAALTVSGLLLFPLIFLWFSDEWDEPKGSGWGMDRRASAVVISILGWCSLAALAALICFLI